MKKITLGIITFIATFCFYQSVFAYPAFMGHWANMRDDDYNYLVYVGEGEMVDVLGISPYYPERSDILYNGIFGSVLTECIGEIPIEYEDADEYYYSADNTSYEYVPTGIYSRVTSDLYIWDENYNIIGLVPNGELVEVIMQSPIDSYCMIICYNGIYGAILTSFIEPTYADNVGPESLIDSETIDEYASTGIYSRVTTDLVLRDQYYNAIGIVPSGAYVEVMQQSNCYSERMIVTYNGLIGSILTSCIEPTYADNIAF